MTEAHRPGLILALVLAAGPAVQSVAQMPTPVGQPAPVVAEPPTTTQLLQRLGARDVPLTEAQDLCAQLQDRSIAIRMQRFDTVQKKYAEMLRTYGKARERVMRMFAKAVPKAQRTALGRSGETKIAALRDKSLAISRGPDLTKERIHDEIDPILEQLRAMVLPNQEKVCAEDDALAGALQSLRTQADTVRGWFDLYLSTMHDIDQDAGGRRHVDQLRQEADPPTAESIDQALDLLCLSALPLSARDSKTLEANESLRGKLDSEELLGTLELNRIRIALGLPTLLIDEKLGNAARDHSNDMRTLNFFSHTSPVDGKHTFGDRAARAGTSASAENIAAGHTTGASAIQGWWYSPGHHKNMLGGHARTGLGHSETLWTQMFGD